MINKQTNKQTNMKKLFIFMCSIFLCAVLAACKNNADEEQPAGGGSGGSGGSGLPNTTCPLLSFGFEKRFNDFLDADIIGTIDQSTKTVTVTVPVAAYKKPAGQPGNRKFKLSFTLQDPKAKLYKGTKEQISGETEDLFIKDKEYRVKAEDGSATMYTLHIKIEYEIPCIDPADIETVKQFFGTYGYNAVEKKVTGILYFDNTTYPTVVVCDAEKFISYSLMGSLYTNMRWEKVSENEWVCTTYHKKDFKRKDPRVTATFKIGAGGKITCKQVVNAMGDAPGNEMPKEDGSYVWAADDGHGFNNPTVQ